MTEVSGGRRILMVAVSTLVVVLLLFSYRTSTSGAGLSVSSGQQVTISSGATAQAPEADVESTVSQTFTGTAVQTRYGPVQVEVTISGSTITNVSVPQYPSGDRRDAEINGRALPILVQQTVATQSGDVDMVSGATYTSEGYRESLQAALDAAGL
ncbi:FMN-binding protein [Nocardioides salsibiostraticola]